MTPVDPTVRVVDAEGEQGLGHARRLFRAYAAEYADSIAERLCVQGFEAELAGLPGRYAPPSGCLLLAMAWGVPAGCMALRDLGGGTCERKRLYVAPEHRGRGVGGLLVGEVIRRADRSGYLRMVLDSLPEMADALALYRRHGFVKASPYWDNPVDWAVYLERRLDVTDGNDATSLATVVQDDLAAYFEHLAARIERLVGMLTHEQVWSNPFGFGNSVGRIVVHLTGSLGHYIGAKVAGTGYVRDRPLEFADSACPPADELLGRFREAIGLVVRTLRSQGEAGLTTPLDDCGEPVRDRFGLFLVCAAHVANHVGQIVYLVQAHGHRLDEKVW
jgi:GNAT superfamily N-acetyltransferase